MERMSRIGWSALVGLGALAGCEPGVVVPSGDTEGSTGAADESSSSSSSSTSTTVPEPAESSSGPAPLCTAGAQRCGADGSLETCASDGLAWDSEACPLGTECVPCEEDGCETASCLGPCDEGGPSSSQGCSFLVARQLGLSEVLGPDIDISEEDWPLDGLLLVNPSETENANVDLYELPFGETEPGIPTRSLLLQPGAAEMVPVGTPLPLGSITTVRVGALTWVESDRPIVAYSYNPMDPFVGNDSSMLLPETALGLHYVVPSYPPHYQQFQGAGVPTYFDVIAIVDETSVRWQAPPNVGTWGSGLPIDTVSAGEWSDPYVTNRFEGMRVVTTDEPADPHDWDISGVVVEASDPIYVVGGSRCSAVPEFDAPGRGCDPLTEVLIPLEEWGTRYAVPAPPPRSAEDHYYRIYGGEAGVTVSTEPPGLAADDYTFAHRGDYVDVAVSFGTSFSVNADGPVMVVGYLASRDLAGTIGDPAMYQHVPFQQADTLYSFGAPEQWDVQYVQVVRSVGGADVELDGSPLLNWEPVSSAYESAIATASPGVHVLASSDPFVATQFAYNNSPEAACEGYDVSSFCHSSYAHPVGMRTQRLYEP